ncbi:MAG: hypothetical protein ACRDQ7_04075 [Haloechinothrix sp.]
MYIDESGGTDETVTTEEMSVTVDGEEYSAELNFDLDEDGVNDTAVITEEDGTGRAFVDTDGDGDADQYVEFDTEGQVVAEAAYDASSGDWVATDPGSADPHGAETQTSASGPMTAELPSGEVEVGPATVDTNHDGVKDTAVVSDDQGNTYHFTDVDGDGDADVAVVIGPDGSATTLEHQGGGEWVETTTSEVGSSAAKPAVGDEAWGGQPATQNLEGVAKIDSSTGLWISQN